jgi:hypothetical protein
MVEKDETVTLGWCDNGITDAQFTESLCNVLLNGPSNDVVFSNYVRVNGNQIGRQREGLFNYWANNLKTDWLLWVDSDISFNVDAIKLLWETAEKYIRPVITGIYFISKESEGSLENPIPVIYCETSEGSIQFIHPLPDNQVIKIDGSGFGFVLMHKSIIYKMRNVYPFDSLFMESASSNEDSFIGEDVMFFRKMKEIGIPLYAHTGALVQHIKRFNLNYNYYKKYWDNKNKQITEQ